MGSADNYRKLFLTNKRNIASINFITLVLILLSNCVQGKLHLTKQCGEIVCKSHYYCSSFDHICRPCQETCDKALSNYDEDLCEKDCQDYLHDLLYMRKSLHNESSEDGGRMRVYYDDIQQELLTLKILTMVTIIMSTAVMIVLFFLVIYLNRSRNRLGIRDAWCWNKNEVMELPVIYSNSKCFTLPRNSTEGNSVRSINGNNNVNNIMSRVSTPDVVSRSGDVISTSILSVNNLAKEVSIKKKGQPFRREPSESTLPDYLGYDNPALCSSPTPM